MSQHQGGWRTLRKGLETVPPGYRTLLMEGVGHSFCVEIVGTGPDEGIEADGAVELAKGIADRGGRVFVSGLPTERNLARRAAEEARESAGTHRSRAVIIETNDEAMLAHKNSVAVHLSCPSRHGRSWLVDQFCKASVFFTGGPDTWARIFDCLIAKRTRALPLDHIILLVGKQGHELALLVHHAIESGYMDPKELEWFGVVPTGKAALEVLKSKWVVPRRTDGALNRRSLDPAIQFIESYRLEIDLLAEKLKAHPKRIGVLGTGAAGLPCRFLSLVNKQLTDLLKKHCLPLGHGGYDAVMAEAAQVGFKYSASLAVRAKVEGRVQAINSHHHVLVEVGSIDLRQVGLLGPSNGAQPTSAGKATNVANLFYPGGGGTLQELFHPTNGVRSLVNVDGYWGKTDAFFDRMVDTGAMSTEERRSFKLVSHPIQAMAS